jgi:hypothetical protein
LSIGKSKIFDFPFDFFVQGFDNLKGERVITAGLCEVGNTQASLKGIVASLIHIQPSGIALKQIVEQVVLGVKVVLYILFHRSLPP